MEIKKVLKDNDFSFKKKFGQNFLSDEELLGKIVIGAGVTENVPVLEIGVGAGTLTRALSQKAKKVYGYEIDKSLKPILERTLSGCENVEVTFADALKEDLTKIENYIGEPYKMVSNLPYYITTPLILKFIQAKSCLSITAMVQKEVAYRICAQENTFDYGAITVGINAVGNASIITEVDKSYFYPQPKVDSAVLHIDIDRNKYDIIDHKTFRDVVRCAFSSRRKTLVNNFINIMGFTRAKAEELLTVVNIGLMVRGESLSVEQFVDLSNKVSELKNIS